MKIKSSKGFQIDGTKKFKKVPQLWNQKDFMVMVLKSSERLPSDGTEKFKKVPQ